MLSTQEIGRPIDARVSVFVDLIGDLDATLGSLFADTLNHLAGNGTTDVHVTTRHIAASTSDGLAALGAALGEARRRGCHVAIDPGSRRMRAAFSAAGVGALSESGASRPESGRHLMIARHAPPPKLRKSA